MLNVPKAEDAKAAAEKRAAEILQGDYDVGKAAIERAVTEAIEDGKCSVDGVEVPSSVADTLVAELNAMGYYSKCENYGNPRRDLLINFNGKKWR